MDKDNKISRNSIACVILIILLFLVPIFTSNPYYLYTAYRIFVFIIMAVALRATMSTGQVSFAHAAFMAIGAYSSALLVMKLGLSFWLSLPLAGVIAIMIALLIGLPTLRLKGVYFFLVTFAFGNVILLIIANWWIDVFGGTTGLLNIPVPKPIAIPGIPRIDFDSMGSFYYLGLILAFITVIFAARLDKTRYGKVFKAIRQRDNLAESLGVNIFKYKMLAWIIACFFAAIAGGAYAHMHKVITPGDFTTKVSIYCVIYVLVGGEHSIVGPIIGTVLLVLVDEFIRGYGSIEPMAYGIALVLVMVFMPNGILGIVQRINLWLTSFRLKKTELVKEIK